MNRQIDITVRRHRVARVPSRLRHLAVTGALVVTLGTGLALATTQAPTTPTNPTPTTTPADLPPPIDIPVKPNEKTYRQQEVPSADGTSKCFYLIYPDGYMAPAGCVTMPADLDSPPRLQQQPQR